MSSEPSLGSARPARPARRRRASTVIVLLLVLVGLVLSQLHNEGYAVLIGIAGPEIDAQTGMARLRCTYFTGTAKIINHTFTRPDSHKKARCAIINKPPQVEEFSGTAPSPAEAGGGK